MQNFSHNNTLLNNNNNNDNEKNGRSRGDAGLEDMKIAHAMKATQVLKPYPKIKHEGAKYIVVKFFLNILNCFLFIIFVYINDFNIYKILTILSLQ